MTDEHVISKGIRKRMPLRSKVTETFAGKKSGPRDVLHLVLKKAVCETCNHGWMKELEDDMLATIGNLFAIPVSTTLDPSQQERIATWAIKTALLIEMHTSIRGEGSYVPVDNLRWLAEHHSPPPRARVWLAAIDSQSRRLAWSQSGALSLENREKVGCLCTFSIGNVGFQVFCMDITWPNNDRMRRTLAEIKPTPAVEAATTNIWPGPQRNVVWPPMQNKKRMVFSLDALPEWAAWPSAYFPPPQHEPPQLSDA